MTDSNAALDRARVNRHAGRPWLTDVLSEPGTLARAMPAAVGAGIVWPATLVLSLPVLMFWSLVVALENADAHAHGHEPGRPVHRA